MTKPYLLLAAVGVLIISAAIAWVIYTVDKTVTSGEAYGFSIGETRTQVADRLKEPSRTAGWRIAYLGDTPRTLRKIDVRDIQANDLPENGVVSLRKAEDNPVNTLRLTFLDGRLTELYRYRHFSEFP